MYENSELDLDLNLLWSLGYLMKVAYYMFEKIKTSKTQTIVCLEGTQIPQNLDPCSCSQMQYCYFLVDTEHNTRNILLTISTSSGNIRRLQMSGLCDKSFVSIYLQIEIPIATDTM